MFTILVFLSQPNNWGWLPNYQFVPVQMVGKGWGVTKWPKARLLSTWLPSSQADQVGDRQRWIQFGPQYRPQWILLQNLLTSEICISLLGMGRHRHKKVSDKDAEENITKQLVESGKKEELKNMVQKNLITLSFIRFRAQLQADCQFLFSLSPLFTKSTLYHYHRACH